MNSFSLKNFQKAKFDALKNTAPEYFWGDPLDIRYLLYDILRSVKKKNVLDIGCSAGYLTSALDPSNNVIGIDVDAEAIKKAQNALPHHKFEAVSLENFKTREKFDIIIMAHVNYDFIYTEEALKKIKLMLKNNGRVYFTCMNTIYRKYKKNDSIQIPMIFFYMLDISGFKHKHFYWNKYGLTFSKVLQIVPNIFELLKTNNTTAVSYFVEARKK